MNSPREARTLLSSGEINSVVNLANDRVGLYAIVDHGDTGPSEPGILVTDFNYTAFTSINVIFNVIDDPVELIRVGFSSGTVAEHAFSLTGNDTNINETSTITGSGGLFNSFLLTAGSYNLYADLNVIGMSTDPAIVYFEFQSTSVPEPYTPLLAAFGLFMMIRSRKNAK